MSQPSFLTRLWTIAAESGEIFPGCCGWSAAGDAFIIHDQSGFETKVLTRYAPSCNMKSFVRQMNRYGFRKQRIWTGQIEYSHPNFQRDRPDLFALIPQRQKEEAANSTQSQAKPSLQQKFGQGRWLGPPAVHKNSNWQTQQHNVPPGYRQSMDQQRAPRLSHMPNFDFQGPPRFHAQQQHQLESSSWNSTNQPGATGLLQNGAGATEAAADSQRARGPPTHVPSSSSEEDVPASRSTPHHGGHQERCAPASRDGAHERAGAAVAASSGAQSPPSGSIPEGDGYRADDDEDERVAQSSSTQNAPHSRRAPSSAQSALPPPPPPPPWQPQGPEARSRSEVAAILDAAHQSSSRLSQAQAHIRFLELKISYLRAENSNIKHQLGDPQGQSSAHASAAASAAPPGPPPAAARPPPSRALPHFQHPFYQNAGCGAHVPPPPPHSQHPLYWLSSAPQQQQQPPPPPPPRFWSGHHPSPQEASAQPSTQDGRHQTEGEAPARQTLPLAEYAVAIADSHSHMVYPGNPHTHLPQQSRKAPPQLASSGAGDSGTRDGGGGGGFRFQGRTGAECSSSTQESSSTPGFKRSWNPSGGDDRPHHRTGGQDYSSSSSSDSARAASDLGNTRDGALQPHSKAARLHPSVQPQNGTNDGASSDRHSPSSSSSVGPKSNLDFLMAAVEAQEQEGNQGLTHGRL